MNITRELLNLYVEKGFLTSELSNQVFNDCKTAHVTLREYLLAKEYITETFGSEYHSNKLQSLGCFRSFIIFLR